MPEQEDRVAGGPDERDRAADLVRRFGRGWASFLVLYAAPWRYHFASSFEGAAAYLRRGRSVVAWGDPLCAPEHVVAVVSEFVDSMRGRGLHVCWLLLGDEAAGAVRERGALVVKLGEEPWFDLATWSPQRGNRGKSLRWALNHARRAGITTREYRRGQPGDVEVEAEVVAVQREWERGLGRPIMDDSFLRPAPLALPDQKRVFLAGSETGLQAVAACAPIAAGAGWYVEDILRRPAAPNGTTELLIVDILDRLGQEGFAHATLGLAPFRGADAQPDARTRLALAILRPVVAYFDRRYRFTSLSRFKSKFEASRWESRFAAFMPAWSAPSLGLAARSLLGG